MRNAILAQPYGQPRAGSHARTYNLAWRQTLRRRRGDTDAVYNGCLYLPVSIMMTDHTYLHEQQISLTPRAKTVNIIYVLVVYLQVPVEANETTSIRGWMVRYVQQLLRADSKRTVTRPAICQLISDIW